MVELQTTFVEYANKELEKKQKELTDPIFERILGAIKRVTPVPTATISSSIAPPARSRAETSIGRIG